MKKTNTRWWVCTAGGVIALAGLAAALGAAPAVGRSAPAKPAETAAASPVSAVATVSDQLWQIARSGQGEAALAEPLKGVAADVPDPRMAALRGSVASLEANIAKREVKRAEQIAKVEKELDDALAGERTPLALSKALKSAVELSMLVPDRRGLVQQPRLKTLIERADRAAHEAESAMDWIMASELFLRLNLLLEEEGTYKADVRRLSDRLGMIQLYVPRRLWELRNARRAVDNLKPLPPFNGVGEEYEAKLKGVTQTIVLAALVRAAESHVERTSMRDLLVGALDSVRTMATTRDLREAFAGIDDGAARTEFVNWIDLRIAELLNARADPDNFAVSNLLSDLLTTSRRTVKIADAAVLHEVGNGAFDRLDEFSQVIWPDELSRFKRIMDGEFIGVGIQIVGDEETQLVKVVAPLEGTPAFRAGIKAGDLIKKIDGNSALGISLNQAIEQITGKPGTRVVLTMERKGEEMEFPLERARIPIKTVKGWKRQSTVEEKWDWFIDPEQRIGYVRITGFQDSTTRELKEAINQMKAGPGGLQGLVVDLRFNPGGLLPQAVSVANLFVERGLIVYTETAGGVRTEEQKAVPSGQAVKNIPVAVLVNEGSASASEIVSGALRHYADQGQLRAVLIGARTYGKGSVQNVMPLSPVAMLKLTVAYYFLPDGRLIHRRDKATSWGVDPHMKVEMLPQQISDALTIRQDADTPLAFAGPDGAGLDKDGKPRTPPEPEKLLVDGIDLQLQTALVLMQSQAAAKLARAGR